MKNVSIKICGLTQEKDILASVDLGAEFIGFVLEKSSKRYVSIRKLKELLEKTPSSIKTVALLVNPENSLLEELFAQVKVDFIQLHGEETPKRVSEIYENNKIPIIKAIGIKRKKDLEVIKDYENMVNFILLDAKPENKKSLPGGNGIFFDWRLLRGFHLKTPWFLAGGLNANNVGTAISISGASMVDVSSGVEIEPGKKCVDKISNFIRKVNEQNK